jgi:nitrogen fixation protein FixH
MSMENMGTSSNHFRMMRAVLTASLLIAVGITSACKSGTANSAGSLHVALKVSPDHPSMVKPITFQVHVTDGGGQAVNDAQVNGALTMKLMDMGATQLKFTPKGNGDYEAAVKSLDMSGPWSLAVTAQKGRDTARQSFDVNVFD